MFSILRLKFRSENEDGFQNQRPTLSEYSSDIIEATIASHFGIKTCNRIFRISLFNERNHLLINEQAHFCHDSNAEI